MPQTPAKSCSRDGRAAYRRLGRSVGFSKSIKQNLSSDYLTFDETMLLAWTNMLYRAVPTVLVRTEPALRLTEATV